MIHYCFFFQAEDGIRDTSVTGVQTCALPISAPFDRSGTSPHKRRPALITGLPANETRNRHPIDTRQERGVIAAPIADAAVRSEERRVGKEGRGRWAGSDGK